MHALALARPTMLYILLVYWGERERAPHRRVCFEFSMFIGASVSEPLIDEFNVNFLYFYISIFLYFYISIYIYEGQPHSW